MSVNKRFERRWIDLTVPLAQTALAYDRQLQLNIDSHTLKLVRSGDRSAARAMVDICAGLLGQHVDLHPRVFWQISAAYFETLALGLAPVELSSKKALTGILLQYRALAQGAGAVSESLLNDLLELIAAGGLAPERDAPMLEAVRLAYGMHKSGESQDTAASTVVGKAGRNASVTGQCGPEDQVKVIGDLRLEISTFNRYLIEADEWSRRLLAELGEWVLDVNQSLSEEGIALARDLSVSSERIGLTSVAQIAAVLAQAMRRVKALAPERPQHADLLTDAADEIRRLLHQFAAGFLRSPDPKVVARLTLLVSTDTLPAPALSGADTNLDRLPGFVASAQLAQLQLGGALRQWSARPDNVGARNETLRVLRALKHSAQQAGVTGVYELCCDLESSIAKLGTQALQAQQLAPLLESFDTLRSSLRQLQAGPG